MKDTVVRQVCGLVMGAVLAFPAGATTVAGDAVIEIISRQFPPPGRQLVNMFLHQILDDNRSAIALADTPKGILDRQSEKSSFFGDTGLVQAHSIDNITPGWADAYARNKLRGKEFEAYAGGKGAHAVATLAWKNKAVYTADTDENNAGIAATAAEPLPDPGIVDEAYLLLPWSVFESDLEVGSNASGSLEVALNFNGYDLFSGSVRFDKGIDGGNPGFGGDLVGYEGAFSNAPLSIMAVGLTLSDTARIPINYSDFYNTGQVGVDYSGLMIVSANAVPVPAAVWLFGTGILGLIGFGKRRKAVQPSSVST